MYTLYDLIYVYTWVHVVDTCFLTLFSVREHLGLTHLYTLYIHCMTRCIHYTVYIFILYDRMYTPVYTIYTYSYDRIYTPVYTIYTLYDHIYTCVHYIHIVQSHLCLHLGTCGRHVLFSVRELLGLTYPCTLYIHYMAGYIYTIHCMGVYIFYIYTYTHTHSMTGYIHYIYIA